MWRSVLFLCCILSVSVAVKCTNYDTLGCPCNGANGEFCQIVVPEGTASGSCYNAPGQLDGSARVTCNSDGTWTAYWWITKDDCPAQGTGYALYNGNGTQCTRPTVFTPGAGSWICECDTNTSAAITLHPHGFVIVILSLAALWLL